MFHQSSVPNVSEVAGMSDQDLNAALARLSKHAERQAHTLTAVFSAATSEHDQARDFGAYSMAATAAA